MTEDDLPSDIIHQMIQHLADISARECTITDEQIEHEPNPDMKELLAGMLSLAEELDYQKKEWLESEKKLMKERTGLQRANQELNDFAYVVSHDLKAPLRGIGNLAQWLINDHAKDLDDEGQEYLRLMYTRVQRMESLIKDILEYAQIDKQSVTYKNVDLMEETQAIIELLDPPKAMSVNIVKPLPTIRFTRQLWQQIVQNLISNAIKYHNKEDGLVEVDYEEDEAYYTFWVKDNGPGIDPRYHEKIFKIFQTLNKRDDIDSTGIGLSTVRKIVHRHGGDIWVQSAIGEGAKFLFKIPKQIST